MDERAQHAGISQRSRASSSSSGFGMSLRTVTERCLSPIGYRRTTRGTLPYNTYFPRRHDASSAPQTGHPQSSHTLPSSRGHATTGVDAQTTQHDKTPWVLECTHFGAEIRPIERPPFTGQHQEALESDVTDIREAGSDLVQAMDADSAWSTTTDDSTSRQTTRDVAEQEEDADEVDRWTTHQHQQAGSWRVVTELTLLRRYSDDCTPTTTSTSVDNCCSQFQSRSLPAKLTLAEGLRQLDDDDRSPVPPVGDHHPLGLNECQQQDDNDDGDGATAADSSATLASSFCLAREILHELEEELVEPSELAAATCDNVMLSYDCSDQQTAAEESDLRRPSDNNDDVNFLQRSSASSAGCSNDLHAPTCYPFSDVVVSHGDRLQTPVAESDLHRASDDVTVPRHESSRCSTNDWASAAPIYHCDGVECQTVDEVALHKEYSAATSETAVDDDSASVSTLHDAAAAAADNSTSISTPNREAVDAQATVVAALKNIFAYFIAKLGGTEQKDAAVQFADAPSSYDDDEDPWIKHSHTLPAAAARRPEKQRLAAGRNGQTSLSAAAHLARMLATPGRKKSCDVIGERLALPRPFGSTVGRVLSLVALRAERGGPRGVSRRRCRSNTDDDITRLRRRRVDDDDGEGQSALVLRTLRSMSISSIPDCVWSSGSNHITSSSSSSPSSSSVRSSFYERRLMTDLDDVERAASETRLVQTPAGRSVCSASDFCDDDDVNNNNNNNNNEDDDDDDDDDDESVFTELVGITTTDADKHASSTDLISSTAN